MCKEHEISAEILTQYQAPDSQTLDELLKQEITESNRKLIVLDDDPTGVQTVHNVSVYTGWDRESIRAGFREKNKLFFILTNSRSFTVEQTTEAHREIIKNITSVAKEMKMDYLVISRGDSTLRGHYPLETRLLKEGIEKRENYCVDGEIFCPFFKEGGRFTIDNIHYVRYGDDMIPVGKTEFAGDKTFGYSSSDLCEFIEEKNNGEFPAGSVTCVSLSSLRARDLDGITEQLMNVKSFHKVVVNAIDYNDIKVFCIALYRAMKCGKHFLFRTAASLVKEIGGIQSRPLLTRNEMLLSKNRNGGIVVVGSHTQKTNRQLEALLGLSGLEEIPFNSDIVLMGEEALRLEIESTASQIDKAVKTGKTAVVYTKRDLLIVESDTKEKALMRSVKISDAVQSVIGNLQETPSFVVAKGGITSSDIGTKALRVKRANVLGQLRPGIPVWQTGEESKFPQMPYVIFPGNVGETDTLKEVVQALL